MARKNSSKRNKNVIQNVRVVDKDEGTDDIMCQRFIQNYNVSEGQIRTVCSLHSEFGIGTSAANGNIDFGNLTTSDDFVSFAAQYREFRVRAIRFDIYDVNPNSSPVVNYWATYHTIGGTITTDIESILDRPDARSVTPGDGKASLAWVAHSIPEMAFQPTNLYNTLGGISLYIGSSTASVSTKYTVASKFVVDFRGRQ